MYGSGPWEAVSVIGGRVDGRPGVYAGRAVVERVGSPRGVVPLQSLGCRFVSRRGESTRRGWGRED